MVRAHSTLSIRHRPVTYLRRLTITETEILDTGEYEDIPPWKCEGSGIHHRKGS